MSLALIFVLAALPAAAPQGDPIRPLSSECFDYAHARHLLTRAGFSGTPEEIARVQARGLAAAIAHLVDYETVPDSLAPHGIEPRRLPPREELAQMTAEARQRRVQMSQRDDRRAFEQVRNWWLQRLLRSQRPLEEKLTLFWHGHFTSGHREVRNAYHMAVQNDLLREHASGNFAEFVREISRDPAMLAYLNNNQNSRRAPNENYARELLELFTLGAGNYSEKDIKEAARAFTGWRFQNSSFVFVPRDHDYGEKEFLGRTGRFDGDDIIRIVLEQEAAPRFVARKLLAFFAVEPTEAELEPYARILRERGWELKPLLRTLFASEWFYSDRVRARQIKSPLALVVTFAREMGATELPSEPLLRACANVGQELMQPPNVKGWDGGPAWITSSNLLTRYNITKGMIAGGADRRRAASSFSTLALVDSSQATTAESILAALERRFLVLPLAAERRVRLLEFATGKDGSAPLDFSDRARLRQKLDELLHLLTTTPEFQIC